MADLPRAAEEEAHAMTLRAPERLRRLASFGWLALLLVAGTATAEPGSDPGAYKAAVFTAELDDPSLPYGRKPPDALVKRLDLATSELRKALADKAGIESLDLAPQAEEIRKQAPLFKCNGCAGDIAKALGADLAVTAVAEKGSMQVFNFKVIVAEAASGRVVRQGVVVISANTDDDWTHAARSIVKNRLLAEPLPNRS